MRDPCPGDFGTVRKRLNGVLPVALQETRFSAGQLRVVISNLLARQVPGDRTLLNNKGGLPHNRELQALILADILHLADGRVRREGQSAAYRPGNVLPGRDFL